MATRGGEDDGDGGEREREGVGKPALEPVGKPQAERGERSCLGCFGGILSCRHQGATIAGAGIRDRAAVMADLAIRSA